LIHAITGNVVLLSNVNRSIKLDYSEDYKRQLEALRVAVDVVPVHKLASWIGHLAEIKCAAEFGGILADSECQKGWDVCTPDEKISVKASTRYEDNRWIVIQPEFVNDYERLYVAVWDEELLDLRIIYNGSISNALEGEKVSIAKKKYLPTMIRLVAKNPS